MSRMICLITFLCGIALLSVSCGDPGAGNVANKPANAGNSANNAAAAPAADKAAVEAELKKMMDDFAAALNKGDAASLDKMYSDDYTLVDQNGAMQTKASRLDAIKGGKLKWEGLKFSDLKIKSNPAGDGAVIVGRASGKTTMDGKTEDRNSMVTWVAGKMKDKGWQFVSAQITDIKADAAKANDKPAANANTAGNAAKPPPPAPANK